MTSFMDEPLCDLPVPNFEYGVELATGIALGGEGDFSRKEVLGRGVGEDELKSNI